MNNDNLRRGANKPRHTNNLFGVFGGAAIKFLKKSKREGKVRSLSAVNEMGCEKQQHHQDPKRFKIPNNFLNGCYGASVPRKLRSAMKKRGRESILLDAEKVNYKNNGIESSEKDNVKKSKKQEISQNLSQREGVFGSITKDEEEVAETLYALAAMFPQSDSNHARKELFGETLIENSSVLQDKKENVHAALEVPITGQGASLGPESCLPREASKITSLNETIGQEHSEMANLSVASHSSTPSKNLQSMPETEMVKREYCDKVALQDSELCLAMGLNMSRQSQKQQHEKESVVELDSVRNVDNKQKQHLIKERIKNAESLALWPGLSSVSSNVSHKESRKRCATHVYISHTIRRLEVSKQGATKESKLHNCNEMRAPDESKREVLSKVHNVNGMRNRATCTTLRNTNESKNGSILLQQCHYGETSQATPTIYDPQKQSFNFLSLSTGSYGFKVDNNNYNKAVSRLEPLSNLQVPYFQSPARQHRVVPNPTQQNRYASSTVYLDQLSVAGPQHRLQQPHYYGSQLCGTQYSSTSSNSKQEPQNFWAMQQQVAQGRSSINCNIVMRTQNPNWQSGRNDSSAMVPCAQTIFPHTSASQEIFGSKIAGRQQQLISPIQDKWTRSSSSQYYI